MEIFNRAKHLGYEHKPLENEYLYGIQRWLREKHGIHILVSWDYSHSMEKEHFSSRVRWNNTIDGYTWIREEGTNHLFDTYEQALEVALQEALKLI